MQRSVHDHDRRDHVVVVVAARLAEPGQIANGDFRDVLHHDRYPASLGAENDVLDILHLSIVQNAPASQALPILGSEPIQGSRHALHLTATDQAYAANVD